jgi:hypothetical protein
MTTKQKNEIRKKIYELIPQRFGKTTNQVKKELFQNCKKNGYGCSDILKTNGFGLLYTENENFENANGEGEGAGHYARIYYTGYCEHVKI